MLLQFIVVSDNGFSFSENSKQRGKRLKELVIILPVLEFDHTC